MAACRRGHGAAMPRVTTFLAVPVRLFMPGIISAHYAALVAAGRIERDPAQEAAIAKLSEIEERLSMHHLARKSSALGWLFASRNTQAPVKGLYLYGGVGRGKTMLMDLFFESSPMPRKRRVHFYEFMAEMHERVHFFRTRLKSGEDNGQDAVVLAASSIAQDAWLLCFDEFHVTDIADAMILGRLFTKLFESGVVVVATSNVAPDDLYKDGLNRGLFVPFISLLKQHMEVMRVDARTDFRLEKLVKGKVWYVPDDQAAEDALDEAWSLLTLKHEGGPMTLMVKGHPIHVPKTALGAARFSFHDLCERPLGAADYLRVAREFHTIVLDHVPVMRYDARNAAKRFIALIDTFYDNCVKLIASAKAPPHELYQAEEGYEASEFQRTASRLIEMGSQSYLSLPHGPRSAEAIKRAESMIDI